MGRGGYHGGRNSNSAGKSIVGMFSNTGGRGGFTGYEKDLTSKFLKAKEPIAFDDLVNNALKTGSAKGRSNAARLVSGSLKTLKEKGVVKTTWDSNGSTYYSVTAAARRAAESLK